MEHSFYIDLYFSIVIPYCWLSGHAHHRCHTNIRRLPLPVVKQASYPQSCVPQYHKRVCSYPIEIEIETILHNATERQTVPIGSFQPLRHFLRLGRCEILPDLR